MTFVEFSQFRYNVKDLVSLSRTSNATATLSNHYQNDIFGFYHLSLASAFLDNQKDVRWSYPEMFGIVIIIRTGFQLFNII